MLLMWSRLWRRVPGVFVPKGPSDGSDSTELAEVLAVYCQEMREKKTRPVGNGMIGSEGTFLHLGW